MSINPILTSIIPHCNHCKKIYSWYQKRCPDCKEKDISTDQLVKEIIEDNKVRLQRELERLKNE